MSGTERQRPKCVTKHLSSLLPVAALLLPASPTAQQPTQLANVNRTPNAVGGSSDPVPLCATAQRAWFRASDPVLGSELWFADASGFHQAADLAAGAAGSLPDHAVPHPGGGDRVLFAAGTATTGRELCVSNGTPAGTRVLRDLEPGSAGSDPRDLVTAGNLVFFVASTGTSGDALWCTDGTTAGTRQLVDLAPDTGGGERAELAVFGQRAVFGRDDGQHGLEPWISDGTPGGTRLLADCDPGGGSLPSQFTDANGTLFLVAGLYGVARPLGRELWRSDGTSAGTRMVVDLWPGSNSPDIEQLTALGDDVFFKAAIDPRADELWRSDGTAAGTAMVRDIHPTPGFGSGIRLMTAFGGRLWFTANEPTRGVELWTSDGTTAGTDAVIDLSPAGSLPQTITGAHGRVWFTAQHIGDASRNATGFELWVTDGTAAGTSLVADIRSGPAGAMPGAVLPLPGGEVVFAADDGLVGREPWVSDGTPANTRLLLDAHPPLPGSTLGSNARGYVTVGEQSFFAADDGVNGTELWVTDGTTAGTRLVADLRGGPAGSDPQHLTAAGGLLWFSADDGATGRELWCSDGTLLGTQQVSDLRASLGSSAPEELTPVGDRLFFAAGVDNVGIELCVVPLDRSAAPRVVHDIRPGFANGGPTQITAFGERVVFRASTTAQGFEPWISDGTSAGTFLLRDIQAGSGSSLPQEFTVFDGRVFFVALQTGIGSSGQEIWVSDGTTAGTQLFVDLQPGDNYSYPEQLTPLGSRMLFTAARPHWVGGEGREPWVTDGTPAGTLLLRDIVAGTGDSDPTGITPLDGDRAVFAASDLQHGTELWITDGTPTGTRLVAELVPGLDGSAPQGFLAVDGGALFTARTATTGRELWFTDGTASGTHRLTDLYPGSLGSEPSDLTVLAGDVLLTLDNAFHGREPWIVRDPGASVQTVAAPCGSLGRRSWCATPRLGDTVGWRCEALPTGTFRVLMLGLPADGSMQLSGCTLAFDPLRAVVLDATNGTTAPRFDLPLPGDPALRGLGVVLQAFVARGNDFGTTTALRLALDR